MPAALPFDAYDTRILAELQADARITLAELGRRVHLSQPAATERVRKLEAAGVVSGYRATVNLAALGYGIRALIRVGRADYARVEALIQQTPEVINAWNVTGEDSWARSLSGFGLGLRRGISGASVGVGEAWVGTRNEPATTDGTGNHPGPKG